MAQAVLPDIRDIVLSNTSFGPREIEQICQAVANDPLQFRILRDAAAQLEALEDRPPATSTRLGVCYYLLGRYKDAVATLRHADSGALAYYYLGQSQVELGDYEGAVASFEKARQAGYDPGLCAVATARARRLQGDPQAALAILDDLSGAIEQTADYLAERAATIAAIGGNPDEVVALYERAVRADGRNAAALFGLAQENDRYGNDDTAIQLYQQAARCFPTYVGVLINLGILYEDRGRYDLAQACYRRVLEQFPDHPRARLFLKDVEVTGDIFFDEEAEKRREQLEKLLSIPVSDFELTVRSRNCLQKMGIETLGDLTRVTEQQLLASKNFGENSLAEIRELLRSKGLEIGQFAHQRAEPEPLELEHLSPDEQALLERPISELGLSVRARKCMVRLGIGTIGELIRKTADELLECKNFGVTSLNEVRQKLAELGLKLRGE